MSDKEFPLGNIAHGKHVKVLDLYIQMVKKGASVVMYGPGYVVISEAHYNMLNDLAYGHQHVVGSDKLIEVLMDEMTGVADSMKGELNDAGQE